MQEAKVLIVADFVYVICGKNNGDVRARCPSEAAGTVAVLLQ